MKTPLKIVLLLLAAMCGQSLFAAKNDTIAQDRPFYDSKHSDDFIEINVHAGAGLSSVLQNYGSAISNISDFFFSPGVLMRGGLDVRFNIRNSFGIGTGLDFGINNSRYAMSIVSDAATSINSLYVSNHFYDLTVPVYVSFRFNMGRHTTWSVDPGWYFSKGIGGHSKLSGYTSGENSLGQPIVTPTSYEHKYFNSGKPFINSVKSFDNGPRLALSLMFRHRVTFSVVGQLSAFNLAYRNESLPVKYRHVSLCFLLGYTI